MSFQMPTHRPISNDKCIRHSTVHKYESQCNVRNNMANIGKMYPERNNLPQNIMDAYRLRDGVTY